MYPDDAIPDPDRTPRRQVIAQSWRRSALSGVSPDRTPPSESTDVASADPLLDAARPVLDDAARRLADTDMSLLLVDHRCRLVSRVAFGATVEHSLDALGVARGVSLSEEAVGTTALGTPAEVRGQVMVNGSEHYLEQFKHLSCFGHPIVHPATRRLAGILCMTEVADRMNPLSVPFVSGIVSDIADRLLDRSRAHQRLVLDAFQRTAPRRDIAVAAIGDDIQLTNTAAAELLSATDLGMLRALCGDPHLSDATVRVVSAAGVELEVLVEPVAGTVGAALFRMRAVPGVAPSAPPAVPRSARACSAVVVGEPGTGRTTQARILAAEHGADPIVVDVADCLIAGTPPDVLAVVASGRRERRPVVFDGVDLLDERSVALLTRAAATATAEDPLILVCGPPGHGGAASAALVARCSTRVDLAPLRHRTTELVSLATTILDGVDAGLSLSAPAADALLSGEWPGNLTELVGVLDHAAGQCITRCSRVVEVSDLPERYRTTTRAAHLSGRELAERQAIVDALERAGRNKVAAARDLGISRTTLYARMRALGI